MRKNKAAIFDIDGTIFRNSLTIELHWQLIKEGVFPKSDLKKIDRYYWAWVNRKGDYQDYLDKVVESFNRGIKDKPVKTISRAARQVVKRQNSVVYRFTRDLIEKLRKTHSLIAISGSPIEIVREFNRYWKFDFILGTEMEIKNGYFTGKETVVHSHDKKQALKYVFSELKQNFSETVGVGDTENDVGILANVDKPICFNPSLKLYEIAKKKKWPVVVERKNVIYKIQ